MACAALRTRAKEVAIIISRGSNVSLASEDYFLQIAAYAMAHDYVYKSNIQQGIIMVCTPDLYYQEFKFSGPELRSWKHKFLGSKFDFQ